MINEILWWQKYRQYEQNLIHAEGGIAGTVNIQQSNNEIQSESQFHGSRRVKEILIACYLFCTLVVFYFW